MISKISGLLFFLLFSPFSSSSSPYSDLFESWCLEHGKTYTSEAEKLARFRVFEDNLAFVENHNAAAKSTYSLALNAFADLTVHEFRAARLGLSLGLNLELASAGNGDRAVFQGYDAAVPDSIDWRDKGAVTQIKDQGSCGICGSVIDSFSWSFFLF
ncbi:ananain-like [Phalaenopsis equestris]|uniref:ananain-like n=1 Tax=Phalaenopsis equestris TaxID=78828 RepID=UPI0009E23377|nr:ananain-like [Phalaenopsis equestris]